MEKNEIALFGAGCFWHIQEEFDRLKGVVKTTAGYMGGDEKKYPDPSYEQISSDRTGYVEVVQVSFNPNKITYNKLLETFWKIHNPTSLNKQGADAGAQYKSIIFYYDEKQKENAEKSKQIHQKEYNLPIVTEIAKAKTFFPAEEYHQNYSKRCSINVRRYFKNGKNNKTIMQPNMWIFSSEP